MSITNEILEFATGGGANVESQAAYTADSDRTNGNQPGLASSALNNKALRQSSFVASIVAQFVGNKTNTDILDDTVTAKFLAQINAALLTIAPVNTKYTSGSGNHNLTYQFFIASGNATAGATYTNNAVTFTVVSTITAGLQLACTGSAAPLTSGTLTKASGTGDATITFYAVRAPLYMRVRVQGAGGGSAGSGGGLGGGGTGGTSSFGTALLTATGGVGGSGGGGGTGGTTTVNSPAVGLGLAGGAGGSAATGVVGAVAQGGCGGNSPFGGAAGGGGNSSTTGVAGATNSGGGAGGAGAAGALSSGGGGGAGGFIDATISSPAGQYAYVVGAGGTAGSAGTSGSAGAVGGSGVVLIAEYYQ